jgi:hypothetical protein
VKFCAAAVETKSQQTIKASIFFIDKKKVKVYEEHRHQKRKINDK